MPDDAYLSNDEDTGNKYAANVVDYGWDSVIPLAGAGKTIVEGSAKIWNDDDRQANIAEVAGGVADLGLNALAFAGDPLNWLITAGLSFVIDFFQPLEDALSLVTGNAERIEPHAKQWAAIGAALAPLAQSIRQAIDDDLIEWKGEDADAARKLLGEFADAVEATGNEAVDVGELLMLFSKLMAAAQALIIGIIAMVVEWALIEWAIAIGLAVPTAGASVAAAATATTVQIGVGTTRAVRIIDKVVRIIWKIGEVLGKIMPAGLIGKVGSSVVEFRKASATMSTVLQIAAHVAGDEETWRPVVAAVGATSWKNETTPSSGRSPEEIDDILDRSA